MTLVISKQYTTWAPDLISTALWLDAADSTTLFTTDTGSTLATNGSAVGRWKDKSGNGRDAVQATPTARPACVTNGLNSRPVVLFDGSNDQLNTPAFVTGQSAAIVATRTTTDSPVIELDFTVNSTSRGYWGNFSGFTSHQNYGINGAVPVASSAGPTAALNLPSIVFQSGIIRSFSNSHHIGKGTPSFAFLNGYIGEICIFNDVLSDTNRQKLEGYLAHKWGLTANLPNDHPFKWSKPPV